jgi:hypothetical protein
VDLALGNKTLWVELATAGSLLLAIILVQWKPLALGAFLVIAGAFAPIGNAVQSKSESQDAAPPGTKKNVKIRKTVASRVDHVQGSISAGKLKASWKGPVRGGVITAGIIIIVLSFAAPLVGIVQL